VRASWWRNGPPPEVRPWVPLEAGERILAWARTPDGWYVLATTRALHHRGGGHGAAVPYESILEARWDPERAQLDVVEAGAARGPGAGLSLPLREPGAVPVTVRERVQASILLTRRVRLDRSAGFIVAVRRSPDGRGPLVAQVTYDAGVDPADPAVATQVDDVVAAVTAQVIAD